MKHKDKNKRPVSTHVDHSVIPQELRELRQWILWRFEWKDDEKHPGIGSWAKVPMQPNGYQASTTNSANWSSFETVITAFEQTKSKFDGIGFVFAEGGEYTGIDIDECVTRNEDEFVLTPFAAKIVERLATYTEFSPSMSGVHCIGKCSTKLGTRKIWNGHELEVYNHGRYFTFTGISWHDDVQPIQGVEDDIKFILEKISQPQTEKQVQAMSTLNVEQRIQMALKNPKVNSLFYGNTLEFGGDESRADQSLCNLLARYSEGNRDILDAMFRASSLFRAKWDEMRGAQTYGNMTMDKALTGVNSFVSVKHVKEVQSTYDNRRTRRFSFHDLWDAAMDFRSNPLAKGVSTGWLTLDELYTPAAGHLSIVTGMPNSGKSTFVDVLCSNIALAEKWKFTFISFETRPMQRHVLNLCQTHLGKPTFSFLPGAATNDEMEAAKDSIGEYFHFIMPDEAEMDMTSILRYVDDDIKDHGIQGFVLDPYTELDQSRGAKLSQTEHIAETLRELQNFTRCRDIHTWLIAHPTKPDEKTFQDGMPTLYSISGAAHFFNKADYGVTVHRMPDNEVKILMSKVRNDISGTKGVRSFKFDKPAKRYYELDEPQKEENYYG